MSQLTLTVVNLGFLALLWLLVLSVTSAMKADIFGVRPAKASRRDRRRPEARPAPAPASRPRKRSRGTPGHAVVTGGPESGTSVDLSTTTQVLFGRGVECTVPLSDEYVSTQHARLRLDGTDWVVEDLGSTNGTYVGKERLSGPVPVSVKSSFRLGKTVVELRK